MKLWETNIDIDGKEKETFLSENKFEAVIIGIRALFRILTLSNSVETIELVSTVFNELWEHGVVQLKFGNICLEETDG